jgi:Polyketide cyclase / dehydrase and lipid transport
MEFTQEITVKVPLSRFVELFDEPANLPKWQEGMLSFEPLAGNPGQPGATSRLTYRQGKGTMEMIETVIHRELPHRFDGAYDVKGIHSVIRNEFHQVGPGATRWVAHNDFRFSGFMKVIALVLRPTFPRNCYKFMESFKAFAEAQPT